MTTENSRADALTYEQRRAISSGIAALERLGWTGPAGILRTLLATPQTERRAEVTDEQRIGLEKAMAWCPHGSSEANTIRELLAAPPVEQPAAAAADDREPVDEVLEIVASYGPYGRDINEGLRFQIVLADEVKRLRSLHEFYVSGAQARAASANETGAEGVAIPTEEMRLAMTQETPYFWRRSMDKSCYEVGIQTNDDWREVISDDQTILATFDDGDAAADHFDRLEFAWRYVRMLEAAPQPAQADARVGLTDEQWYDLASRHANADWSGNGYLAAVKALCDDYRALLAAHPGQPEPRAEVTNPFRELLAALIDIYDDERNNAPEDRCYVEAAWSEVLGEARALLAPLPDPAQVAAESPDWIKNALPPEGA